MSTIIGNLNFDGPYTNAIEIRPEAGVYAIVCQQGEDFELLDLCESERVDRCLIPDEYANNLLFYEETCSGSLSVLVHYTPDMDADARRSLRNQLMAELNEQFLEEAC